MPEEQQVGLLCNLSRVLAQETIQHQRYNPTDYEGIYKLYLEAYGDKELAEQAQIVAAKRLVREETEAARAQRQRP